MSILKDFFKRIIYKEKATSESYVDHMRKKGVLIGNDCIIYAPIHTFIDLQYPWMVTIGDHVRITDGVKILTHDYSWSVIKAMDNEWGGVILGASGAVSIGNNVFIGMNTVITRNVKIEDNVIIGAGSVVTKDCQANSVYAGTPAKRIMGVKEFYEKRLEAQISEAKELAVQYYARYHKRPEKSVFHEYFMLFCTVNDAENEPDFRRKLRLCDNYEQSIAYMKFHTPPFKNYEDFMRYCFYEGSE